MTTPYLQFQLDAMEHAEAVGAASDIAPDTITAGLLRLDRFCWRRKSAHVTAEQLPGFFRGGNPGPTLVAFGFLRAEAGGWVFVAGERYEKTYEAQSEAAKATNAKRWGKPQKPAEERPESDGGSDRGAMGGAIAGATGERSVERSLSVAPSASSYQLTANNEQPLEVGSQSAFDEVVERHTTDFFAFAETAARARGLSPDTPGEPAFEAMRYRFKKYRYAFDDVGLAMRACYVDFLDWAKEGHRTAGWGLWLSDGVWEPRFARLRAGDVRALEQAIAEARRWGRPGKAQEVFTFGPLNTVKAGAA